MSERRARFARCDGCGDAILGHDDGDECPRCGEVLD